MTFPPEFSLSSLPSAKHELHKQKHKHIAKTRGFDLGKKGLILWLYSNHRNWKYSQISRNRPHSGNEQVPLHKSSYEIGITRDGIFIFLKYNQDMYLYFLCDHKNHQSQH